VSRTDGLLDEPDGYYSFPVIEGSFFSPTGKPRILGYHPQRSPADFIATLEALRQLGREYVEERYGWRVMRDDELGELG
jgi:hypothetical protein